MRSRDVDPAPLLSVVAPAHNEQDNVAPLVREIGAVLDRTGLEYEVVIIDDGSTDETPVRLSALLNDRLSLRAVRLSKTPKGRGNGQSAAFHAGFRASRGSLIATLDADLQNDPSDLPRLLATLREHDADMVQGSRQESRSDGSLRSFSSWVGRFFRRMLLGDTIIDTGCSLRVMKRDVALRLPLEYRGMHRFIPITARNLGYKVLEVPVAHRTRTSGKSKYGMWNRAIPGLIDCLAVCWMRNRRRPVDFLEVEPQHARQPRSEPAPRREVHRHEVMS